MCGLVALGFTNTPQTRAVAKAMKSKDFDKALELRGPEFLEMLHGFAAVSSLQEDSQGKLPENQVSEFPWMTSSKSWLMTGCSA